MIFKYQYTKGRHWLFSDGTDISDSVVAGSCEVKHMFDGLEQVFTYRSISRGTDHRIDDVSTWEGKVLDLRRTSTGYTIKVSSMAKARA